MDTKERNEHIELYGRGFDLLMAAVDKVPQEAIHFKPEPKEWSVHEVVVHLADSESIAAQHARSIVAEPGKVLMAYDQDVWADNLHYHDGDYDESLQLLKWTRAFTYRWYKSLPEEAFSLSAEYPGDDKPYVLEDLVRIYAGHIPDHVEQIENNVKIWKSTQV